MKDRVERFNTYYLAAYVVSIAILIPVRISGLITSTEYLIGMSIVIFSLVIPRFVDWRAKKRKRN